LLRNDSLAAFWKRALPSRWRPSGADKADLLRSNSLAAFWKCLLQPREQAAGAGKADLLRGKSLAAIRPSLQHTGGTDRRLIAS
jgi:hypothetical protein